MPLLEWEDMNFTYGMDKDGSLFHRATNAAGSMYTELRIDRARVLELWPANKTAGDPSKRKRGPKPVVLPRVKQLMIAYNNAHGNLAAMTEESMVSQFQASRDTCRNARNEVLGIVAN